MQRIRPGWSSPVAVPEAAVRALISMTGESVPMPEGTPFPPASSIRLTGTNVLTDTRSDALGGKIELKASGPIQLHNTTISSNVNDVRPQSANVTDQGGNIDLSAGSLMMQGSGISTLSGGTQNGGNVVYRCTRINHPRRPVRLFQRVTRGQPMPATLRSTPGLSFSARMLP